MLPLLIELAISTSTPLGYKSLPGLAVVGAPLLFLECLPLALGFLVSLQAIIAISIRVKSAAPLIPAISGMLSVKFLPDLKIKIHFYYKLFVHRVCLHDLYIQAFYKIQHRCIERSLSELSAHYVNSIATKLSGKGGNSFKYKRLQFINS